jgi:hypothetical protein
MMMGAGSSTKLVPRVGTTRIVTAGLLGMAGILTTTLLWSYDMPYWPIGLWFLGAAIAMSSVMAPSTESVMGAVPEEKAGVASAMNDVTRQVAGALGTAVIGSLITSFYTSRISDDVASLPEPARSAAKESIGQANAVAAQLPAAQGDSLAHSAATAFTSALGLSFAIAAGVALVGGLAVRRWLPAHHAAEVADVAAEPVEQKAA